MCMLPELIPSFLTSFLIESEKREGRKEGSVISAYTHKR